MSQVNDKEFQQCIAIKKQRPPPLPTSFAPGRVLLSPLLTCCTAACWRQTQIMCWYSYQCHCVVAVTACCTTVLPVLLLLHAVCSSPLPLVGYCFVLLIFLSPLAIGTLLPMLLPALLLLLPLLSTAMQSCSCRCYRCCPCHCHRLTVCFLKLIINHCSHCVNANVAALAVAIIPRYLLHHGAFNTTSATDYYFCCHCHCCWLIACIVLSFCRQLLFSMFAVLVPSCLCCCQCCGYHCLCCTLRHSIASTTDVAAGYYHCHLSLLPVAGWLLILFIYLFLIASTLSMLQPTACFCRGCLCCLTALWADTMTVDLLLL